MATQMQLKVLFGKKSHGRPDFFRNNLVPRAFPLKNGWGGKRPAFVVVVVQNNDKERKKRAARANLFFC